MPAGAICSATLASCSWTPPRCPLTGAGGETLGARGHSKDHRPDLKQMILGVVIDAAGPPGLHRDVARQHRRCRRAAADPRPPARPLRDRARLRGGRSRPHLGGHDHGPGGARAGIHPGRPRALGRAGAQAGAGRCSAVRAAVHRADGGRDAALRQGGQGRRAGAPSCAATRPKPRRTEPSGRRSSRAWSSSSPAATRR